MEKSLTILIVDDEPDVAASFATLLEAIGFEVRTAHDGSAALETLDEWSPDVAFVDLGMPQMNGFEVADRIVDRQESPPYLIALTGYGRAEDRERAREHGFDQHLVKPADIDEILAILDGLESGLPRADR